MLMPEDSGIADFSERSMCKVTGSWEYGTPLMTEAAVDAISDKVLVTRDDLDRKSKELICIPDDFELRTRSDVVVPVTLPDERGESALWDLEGGLQHGIREDSCEEVMEGNNDISIAEFFEVMVQEGCKEADATLTRMTDYADMDQSPAFNSEISTSSPHRMSDGEATYSDYLELDGPPHGTPHMMNEMFLHQSSPAHEPFLLGIGRHSRQPGVLDVGLVPSSSCQTSSAAFLSDEHANCSSFDSQFCGDSWNSMPTAGNEGSDGLESASGRFDLQLLDGDDGLRFTNAVTLNAPRYLDHAHSAKSLQEIDQDRPIQTCGSVLASEGMVTDSRNPIGNAGASIDGAGRIRVTSRADVVDLTEDSDDDVECIDRRGRVGQVKRKAGDDTDECIRKRPPVFGERPYTTQVIDSKNAAPERMSVRQQPFGEEPAVKVQSVVAKQVPQQWNTTGAWRLPPSKESVQIERFPSTPISKEFAQTVADKRSSMQLSTYNYSSAKRNLPGSLEGSANPASLNKGTVTSEEASPDELSVALLKHQRMALRWMLKRELEKIPSGGILADDQGLGKTVTTISLILKARAPLQKTPVNNVSALPKTLTVELDDDDDVDSKSQADGRSQGMSVSGKANDCDLPHSQNVVGSVSGLHNAPENIRAESAKRRPAAGTLVVCPTSVLRQWAHELKDKVKASAGLTMLTYHGSSRTKDPDELAKYDVVLTTYSIVSMESPKQALADEKESERAMFGGANVDGDLPPPFRSWKAKKPKKSTDNGKKCKGSGSAELGPLARLNWFRVVLDEAQSIKNSRTQVARAAWSLRAKRRWCLSGTPIQNAIDDLYSYFKFLRCYPYDSYKVFRERIKDPCARTPAQGYRELHKCLSEVMIRRTKATLIDGQPIVDLPARVVTLKQAQFSDEERAFYNNLERESRKQFKDYATAGTLQSNYVNILWMLLRLRQACDHPLLVKGNICGSSTQNDVLGSAKELPVEKRRHLLSLLVASKDMCSICNDVPEHPVVCICTHIFCRQCILDQLATGEDRCCPKCRTPLNTSSIYSLSALRNPDRVDQSGSDPSACVDWRSQDEDFKSIENIDWKSSAKINAVIETLSCLPVLSEDEDEDVKTGKEGSALQAGHKLEDAKPSGASSVRIVERKPVILVNRGRQSFAENGLMSFGNSQPDLGNMDAPSHTITRPLVDGFEVDGTSSDAALIGYDGATFQAVKQEPLSADIGNSLGPPKKQTVTEKAIVFSQWTSMLDLLEVKLKDGHFNYRRLDGTMSVVARDRAVSEFKTQPEVTVIIMSLKAASLGLNMVAACHVLLLDVWWNPTTEDQAIDRAHRIGQTKVVRVSRFTVKDTIEDRILALQEKKRRMVATAFGDEGAALQRGGLTPQELHHLFGVS